MRNFIRIVVFTMFAACGGSANDQQVLGAITLAGVSDASGIVVTLVGPTGSQKSTTVATKTAAAGTFVFEKIEKGDYLLTARVSDSLEQQHQVIVSKTDKAVTVPPLSFTIVATVTGQVNVQDAAGAPGAVVSISGGTSAVADANGAFEIRGVKLGTQAVAASFRDYPVATGQVEVTRGTVTAAPLTLSLTQVNVVVPKGTLHGRLTMVEPGDFSFTKIRVIGSADAPTAVDADGHYSLDLDPGTYALVAETPFHASTDLGVHQVRSKIDLDLGNATLTPFLRSFLNGSNGVSSFLGSPRVTQSGRFLARFNKVMQTAEIVSPATAETRPFWSSNNPTATQLTTIGLGNGEQFIFSVASQYFAVDCSNGHVSNAGFTNNDSPVTYTLTASGKRAAGMFNPPGGFRARSYALDGSSVLERDFSTQNQHLLLSQNRFMLVRRTSALSLVDLDGPTLDDVAGTLVSDAVSENCLEVPPAVSDKYCIAAHGTPGARRLAIFQPSGSMVESQALSQLATVGDLSTTFSAGDLRWQNCANDKCIPTDGALIRITDGAVVTRPAAFSTMAQFTPNPSATRAFYTLGASNSCVEALTPGGTLDCSSGPANEHFAFVPSAQGWLSETRWIAYDSGAAHTVFIKDGDGAPQQFTDISSFGFGAGVAYWTTGFSVGGSADDILFVVSGDSAPIQITSATAPAQHRQITSTALFGTSPDHHFSYIGAVDNGSAFSVQINNQTNQARVLQGIRTSSNITNSTAAAWLDNFNGPSTFETVLLVHDTLQQLWVGTTAFPQESMLPAQGTPGRVYFDYFGSPIEYTYQTALQP